MQDNGTTKINAFNTDARVYPTSQAPAMKNTKTINGVTFSEYIKHKEIDYTATNGEKVHQVSVWLGVDSCMHSSASDARFIFHDSGFTAEARVDTQDRTYTTGERCNYVVGRKFMDLEAWDIKPFADKKGANGEYVGNLTWQFLKHDEEWENYKENLDLGFTNSQYSHSYDVIAIVNGVQTNFTIITTTEGTPKGDNTTPVQSIPVETVVAEPTSSPIYVNGKMVDLEVYNINGSNYFKLRDVAYVLNGTEKQFDVGWNANSKIVDLTTNQPYSGELSGRYFQVYSIKGKKTDSSILVDGVKKDVTAYNLAGANYFKLRDLGQTFDFYVGWDSATKSVTIDTTKGYQ